MHASTLHGGVSTLPAGEAPSRGGGGGGASASSGSSAVVRELGEAAGPRAGGNRARESRSFQNVLKAVEEMTSGRPNRCPDNIAITERLLDRLNLRPVMQRIRFVHIAGTKGKGTTSAYTAALLQAYGFKVGLFTSPHLTDVRERILVDNRLLSCDVFAQHFFDFREKYDALKISESQLDRETASRANFFRFMFLLCLYIFDKEQVEVAVMEVGLGGRIDATNTVPSEVSIITSLGYDHMEILGNRIEDITREKAGIMKKNVVCFASPQVDHPETRCVLEAEARQHETPLVLLDKGVIPILSWPKLAIGGDHAVEDSKLAFMAARFIANIPPSLPLDEAEREVLRTMTFAGRSQITPVNGGKDITLYLDGAHTAESLSHAMKWFMEASAAATGDANPRRVLLFYTSRDPKLVLKAFMPHIRGLSKVIVAQLMSPKLTITTADDLEGRAGLARQEMVATTECWRSLYREVPCLPCAQPFSYFEDIMDLALPAASDDEDASKPAQVFVCGSFYLLGDIIHLLKQYTEGHLRPE